MSKRSVAAIACLAALGLGGCSSGDRAREYRSNPTPELASLAKRPADIDNRRAYVRDTYYRSAVNDLGRFWLMDRPSRLMYNVTPF